MRGFQILQEMRYPVTTGKPPQTLNVGVLPIENPAWPVMVAFLRSEIAIRKSDRDEPMPTQGATGNAATVPLPPVNFQRIKTIISVRSAVLTAGDQPLLPPFSLDALWPVNAPTARRMYEFRSFEEFRLDLREMVVQDLETLSLELTLIAFVCGFLATVVRRVAFGHWFSDSPPHNQAAHDAASAVEE